MAHALHYGLSFDKNGPAGDGWLGAARQMVDAQKQTCRPTH
jgi:hypothetical protein